MRLQKADDKYEFDFTFYALAFVAMAVVASAFWYAKKLIDRSHGREVQTLMTTANLDSPEAYRRMAKNWIAGPAAHHRLTPDQRAEAEKIIAKGLQERKDIWKRDRLDGAAVERTKSEQAEQWKRVMTELDSYLRSIKKIP